MNIPKAMVPLYGSIASWINEFSDAYLDEEYRTLCLHALEKLCRKRPSPLLHGKANSWAAGIVYAIGANNFIFDKSMPIHMTGKEIAEPFGVSSSTASAKASEIRKALGIDQDKAEWVLPSLMEDNPLLWMVMIDGFVMDARSLPRELQEICFEKKLIPYVPDKQTDSDSFQGCEGA